MLEIDRNTELSLLTTSPAWLSCQWGLRVL